MRTTPQTDMLERAAIALGPFKDDVVFVGGCVVSVLLTDPAASSPRPTDDVDVLVQAASYADYVIAGERMRSQKFVQEPDDKVICRWRGHGLVIDIMPTDDSILGFSNRWYPSAVAYSVVVTLPQGTTIRVVNAPHFVATKLEAFGGRGRGDIYGSHDLEDVVAVVDGRAELLAETANAPSDVRDFIRENMAAFLKRADIRDAIEGHLGASGVQARRGEIVMERMRALTLLR